MVSILIQIEYNIHKYNLFIVKKSKMKKNVVSITDLLCSSCQARFRGICSCLSNEQLNEISQSVKHTHYPKGKEVINFNEDANKIYNIVNGSIRQYKILPDGRRQIVGFLFSGDFLGIPYEEKFSYYANTIEDTCLCVFSRQNFESYLVKFPAFEKEVLKKISLKLSDSFDQNMLLGKKQAREKLATFLILILKVQKNSQNETNLFKIPMTREDIADYLGLRTETTSRMFTEFCMKDLIGFNDKNKSYFQIKNLSQLKKISKIKAETV